MRSIPHLLLAAALTLAASACEKTEKLDTGPVTVKGSAAGSAGATHGSGSGSAATPTPPPAPAPDIDSKDILARTATSPEVDVKHVLIGWKDLGAAYRGHLDPRAAKRTADEAAALAKEVADKLKAAPDSIDALIKQYSEDPGGSSGDPYTIDADSQMVPPFKNLSLRLQMKEVGIVKSPFGYHVIERVAAKPLDPLESADILARPANPGEVSVQHVLIGWKDVPAASRGLDPRAKDRTKAEADKIAQEVLAKLKGGADMTALMKQYSEDPGSKDDGKAYDVSKRAQLVDSFKKLSLRLAPGEAGMVISPFGWHIIRRMPPDSLESTAVLERPQATEKAKVKHILLGWTDVHASDPRGTKRTRAELEKLVKDTVAKLDKGAPIEPLMKELSEDPGSAASGEGYDVSPSAQLVEPFKLLSLRLKVGETGVVKTQFGIHIIKRVE
ncbi:MAG: peptidylprolyl isomerase [Deltaproteobacteria bacterium]|nr:peptidylprolyl isomerase [Deltaproteobacteria bacterium]